MVILHRNSGAEMSLNSNIIKFSITSLLLQFHCLLRIIIQIMLRKLMDNPHNSSHSMAPSNQHSILRKVNILSLFICLSHSIKVLLDHSSGKVASHIMRSLHTTVVVVAVVVAAVLQAVVVLMLP